MSKYQNHLLPMLQKIGSDSNKRAENTMGN